MIKYNNSTINDWYYDASNIIKVYRNNAVCYYKLNTSGDTPTFDLCYAVVEDISQYSEREFIDVFNKSDGKWYKLNNLNQYEEYGVYGSGRTLCEGSTSRLPDGYTEVEYIENTSTAYIDTSFKPNQNTRITLTAQTVTSQASGKLIGSGAFNKTNAMQFCYEPSSTSSLVVSWGTVAGWTTYSSCIGDYNVHTYDWNKNEFYRDDTLVGSVTYANFQCTDNLGIFRHIQAGDSPSTAAYFKGKIFNLKIFDNGTLVRDFVPAKRDSDDKYGLYDLITDTFYTSPNGNNFIGGSAVTPEPSQDCVTTYEGKLTFEHVVTPAPSRLPNGYTEVEYIQNTGTSTSNGAYINSGLELYDVVGNSFSISGKVKSEYYAASGYDDLETIINSESVSSPYYGFVYRYAHSNHVIELSCNPSNSVTLSSTANSDGSSDIVINCNSTTVTDQVPLGLFASYNANYTTPYRFAKATIYSMSIVKNGTTVRNFVPAKRDSDDKYGLYDLITDTFYISPNGNNFIGGTAVTPSIITSYEYLYTGDSWVYLGEVSGSSTIDYVVYPMYYDEKSDPLDNLTFTSTTQAEDYAYNNCVYDGMNATIEGNRYVFDSEEGWVYVPEYYKVEDVTPNSASGWTISGSSTYNPDSSYYDDFDLETTETSMSYKIAKVTIYGYDHFTYYLRSYNGYSPSYGYVMASNIDELSTDPTSMGYNSNAAITSTYYFNKTASSDVNLNNYRRVTYNNLDKTVEHTFYVVFYGRTYGSYVGNATILIPKNQTNENWEQVTFLASSNVASSQKNLYIDGNNSTSGGTQYWYYRWMIGLPSGSHTSYTNYSDYNYCPNVTSSTFTSVAGEQRQVNFTYDGTYTNTLSFRLTDGSNVLTPSETVYFNMTYYNSCGVSSSSSNVTFPRSQSVKVGGRFRFANSSNRHYIYGYSPNISLNYDYYVNNYQSTFDITYAKLSDEAVTITYTTYDPNDSEIPAFKTDITWPYSGGTTSSTTLTSYDVPYTYPYEVSQTSDKFSADKQSYTANQAAREISFILYPNNREFATVADMEAYQYAWEGMKATVGDKNYKYENGEWVEKQHSLPDVPFVLNYNAKQYNASTHTIPYTEGALNAIDAVITGTTANIIDHHTDGYIQLTGSSSTTIRALVGTTYFSRSSSNPNITIVCKAYTTSGTEGNILSNRKESYNWMYRHKQTVLTFHGTSEQGSIAVSSSEPNTCSVRIDSNRLLKYNNWTQNTTSSYSNFNYGSNSNGGALFSGYYSSSGEFWKGCFYWIYMTLNTLTDEQVQQVIDYNENL